MPRFWQCRDCERLYDIDVDKCIECGNDDWQPLYQKEYVKRMRALLDKLEGKALNPPRR